jgi:hypothetical protein
MATIEQLKPQARSEGLVIQELPDELLIYDLERDKAHCLNQTAAIVWKNCDGKTSVSELAQILSKESGLPVNDEVVWLALEQLGKARLLPIATQQNEGKKPLTRREVIKRIGLGAAVAIPLVTSIVAPQVSQASTCPQGSCIGQPVGFCGSCTCSGTTNICV